MFYVLHSCFRRRIFQIASERLEGLLDVLSRYFLSANKAVCSGAATAIVREVEVLVAEGWCLWLRGEGLCPYGLHCKTAISVSSAGV